MNTRDKIKPVNHIVQFLKANWWKLLIALAVLGIGIALCVTGIGSLLGVPLITSAIAGTAMVVTTLGAMGVGALITCGGLAIIGTLAYIFGKITDHVKSMRAVVLPEPGLSSTSHLLRELPSEGEPTVVAAVEVKHDDPAKPQNPHSETPAAIPATQPRPQ